ncbi:MAG: homoserine dehydrogenase [Lachnospiraceae bacterium]|nr:homoserine dehydrogenase [Lachnospiraceae bacterium]MBR1849532.1 homoserine dehydrogenase [Lachnospiraceae bacterium]
MIRAAILGYGNIGGGVAEVITKNQDQVAKAVGDSVEIKYVLDLREFPGDPMEKKVVHDIDTIINDPEIKVIAETMGGDEPAYTFTKKALEAGKSVCTSNKELVANHGPELMRIAKEHDCNYFIEASVGGGIPIIRTLNEALKQEHILNVTGIVNGTTNYILTKMEKEGAAYADVLKQAQDLGYAERNPEADVEGYDACRKIAILSSLMSGKNVDFKEVYTEGITKIGAEDFLYAKKMGKTIKLLAMSKKEENGYNVMVAPFYLGENHPLYPVNDVFNAVFVKGDMLDDSMYYGRGAGKLPTASAVVADMIQAARNLGKNLPVEWSDEKETVLPVENTSRAFFVRLDISQVTPLQALDAFGGTLVEVDELSDEVGILTKVMTEKECKAKCEALKGVKGVIRVEA